LLLGYTCPEKTITEADKPLNIIFMVGDGMGLGQITAGMYARHNMSQFERFPVTGLIATHSSRQLVTDSGAGATAFACGCKTYNGAIGVDGKKVPCSTLLELADSLGLSTGIVVTSSLTHATPASFYAHVNERANMEDIAVWMVQQRIDFLVGGGSKYFNKRTKDQRNLIQEMRKSGYEVAFNPLDSIPNPKQYDQPFCWFTAEAEPPAWGKGRTYLSKMVEQAPQFLQKRNTQKGFFMLVEGSQIDWTGHANDKLALIDEMNDFEAAVKAALDFAEKDGHTLVVVTADHETGGMGILQGSNQDSLEIKYATKSHTALMIPVFAYGPGAQNFNGVYQNTDIYFRIKKAMRWD
jgi:alkaline phosphatase